MDALETRAVNVDLAVLLDNKLASIEDWICAVVSSIIQWSSVRPSALSSGLAMVMLKWKEGKEGRMVTEVWRVDKDQE